ncbi:hypothetical protein D3Z60_00485 [Lachnospiraceae bacterium]|nr:hypothetical protein [Lachnospiraceae bacterium]
MYLPERIFKHVLVRIMYTYRIINRKTFAVKQFSDYPHRVYYIGNNSYIKKNDLQEYKIRHKIY